jgi:hypothetical protein
LFEVHGGLGLWVERLGTLVRISVRSFNLKPGWAAIPDFARWGGLAVGVNDAIFGHFKG